MSNINKIEDLFYKKKYKATWQCEIKVTVVLKTNKILNISEMLRKVSCILTKQNMSKNLQLYHSCSMSCFRSL